MTFPRSRHSRRRAARRPPQFAGDFPGDADADTLIDAIRPAADYDGRTYTFGGASVAGLDPAQVYGAPVAEEAIAIAQAIEATGLAQRRRASTGPHPRLRAVPPPPDAPRPPPAPVAPPGDDAIARELAGGWPHLFEIRCGFPAAASATPIPCGAVHRDDGALTFRWLRASAFDAGWHMDAHGRMTCPRCCQASGEYRTLYPVTHYDTQAGQAHVAGDAHGEFWHRAAAEHDLFRDVHEGAQRGRHAGVAS